MYSKKDDINNTSACEHMKIVVTDAKLTFFFKKDNFEYKREIRFKDELKYLKYFSNKKSCLI